MELLPHQSEALRETEGLNRVAYYYDMGLGKTFIGSEKMKQLKSSLNLLICQKSKINDWVQHFEEHYPEMLVIDYTKNRKIDAVDMILYSGKIDVVVIINYELVWRRPELTKLTEFTLMLDESSLIQNYQAKQSRFIVKSLHPVNVILLSGTPCGGKFENLWTQLNLLGSNMSKTEFEKRFVNFEVIYGSTATPIRIVDRKNPYKDVDGLKKLMRKNGAVFKKTEEVMTLPEQRFIKIECPVTDDYRTFRKEKVVTVEGKEFVGSTSFAYRLGLRQLASGYSDEKYDSFSTLLESTTDRLIVFYNFNIELVELKKIIRDHHRSISEVNGPVKDLKAYEEDESSVTLCQYQAGSMGLNLQKANKIIYFSLPERSDLFEQSKKRIHRIGQKNSCTYYIMMSRGTIDYSILKALERKEDYTDELFREEFR
jgi:SNF2 family DNA or RNA helicase